MKFKFLLLALLGILALEGAAQTVGNGVTITNYSIDGSTLAFEPTTVGTTATYDLLVTNLVGVTQDVTISGVEAPFSLSETVLTLDAQEAMVVTLSFDPLAVGQFSDQLIFAGSIFGSGSLDITGEGTQIDIETNASFVQFANTAIGSSSSVDLTITNSGSGTMLISSFDFSDSQFTVVEESLTIAEGESYVLTITFTPIFAGGSTETLTINSNDPSDPALVIDLAATGISEVSGELCGTWSVVNSPYILVDNVTIPEDCSLTIEAGVEVQGNGYSINATGLLQILGEENSRVRLIDLDVDAEIDGNNQSSIEYVTLDRLDINMEGQPIPFDHSWDSGVDGWTSNSSLGTSNGRLQHSYWASCCWREYYCEGPLRSYSGQLGQVSFEREITDYNSSGNGSEYVAFEVNVDETGWTNINSEYYIGSQSSETFTYDLSDMTAQSTVQFRFRVYFYTGFYLYLDNFHMNVGEAVTPHLEMSHVNVLDEMNLTGQSASVTIDSLKTKYADWNQERTSYEVTNWEVEMHSEHDQGAYFRGNDNAYNYSYISLNNENFNNERGLYFDNTDGSSISLDSSSFSGAQQGLYFTSIEDASIQMNEIDAHDNQNQGIYLSSVNYSDFIFSGVRVTNNNSQGLYMSGIYNSADVGHSIFSDNNSTGFEWNSSTNNSEGDSVVVFNSGFMRNNGTGLYSNNQMSVSQITSIENTGYGIHMSGSFYGMSQRLTSSILWGNGANQSWNQLYIDNNLVNIAFTNLMDGESGITGNYYNLDNSCINDLPYFTDDAGHMEAISPGVDGGKPWEIDAHMPMGLGGARADMGMYGGPNNAYWGGDVIQDGSSTIGSVDDIPQDQGNMVGLTFSSSHWDNSAAIDPVTIYSIWRHMDVGGAPILSVDQGSWELIGEVPAQGFDSYGFQATTLGNTNQFGDFSSCYTVIAETELDQLYWQSNVMCGESIDNLAPDAPEVETGLIEPELAQVSWFTPAEEDYAYTVITSDHGFTAEVVSDTVTFDTSVLEGQDYTYYVQHVDANGNMSDLTTAVLTVEAMLDIIPLNPGWNLISIDRNPSDDTPASVFSELLPGNLQYVTGFDGGAMIYDPSGLSFLNTLTTIEAGRGYWVKVDEADELRVSGALIPSNYQTPLVTGWNLVGFAGEEAAITSYYADELANNEIVYVTGFDQGSTVFDPNGLSFLNTLTNLENGFGYWVKADLENGLVLDTDEHSNFHDFVNGQTHPSLEGEFIHVVNPSGDIVVELEVIEGGWLRTAPLYEATASVNRGDHLSFHWNGKTSSSTIEFDGNRKLHAVVLDFVEESFTVFPNPVRSDLRVAFNDWEPIQFTIQDASGRSVMSGNWTVGQSQLDVSSLVAGMYAISFGDAAGNLEVQTFMIAD